MGGLNRGQESNDDWPTVDFSRRVSIEDWNIDHKLPAEARCSNCIKLYSCCEGSASRVYRKVRSYTCCRWLPRKTVLTEEEKIFHDEDYGWNEQEKHDEKCRKYNNQINPDSLHSLGHEATHVTEDYFRRMGFQGIVTPDKTPNREYYE